MRGTREGFKFTSLDKEMTGAFVRVEIKEPLRVGKYGVDLETFEHFLGSLPLLKPDLRLVIIDKIGKMECLSAIFRSLVASLLDAPAPVIANIALKTERFIDEVKHRRDVYLYEITERNTDALLLDIARPLRSG
jgi:nucleoside-triphosphatase